jgi:hypothetical protein
MIRYNQSFNLCRKVNLMPAISIFFHQTQLIILLIQILQLSIKFQKFISFSVSQFIIIQSND